MKTRQRVAVGVAAAVVLLGGAGTIAAAHTFSGPPAQGPALTNEPANGPDTPGVVDPPEPGDAPD
jgi:hypothetical protein